MFKFFLIIILTLGCKGLLAADDNEKNRIFSMDEIGDDLKKRKKELEGFTEDEVKIDLESLGLDDVEEVKPKEVPQEDLIIKEPEIKDEKIAEKDLPPILKTVSSKPNAKQIEVKNITPEAAPKESSNDILSKVQAVLKPEDAKKAEDDKAPKPSQAPAAQFINKEKKANIAKRKKLEKKLQASEAKEKKRLKELHELREKYLRDAQNDEDGNFDQYLNSSEDVIPKRKELNRFANGEIPAPPLLSDYRMQNNLHIPLTTKPKERLDILFATIAIDSVSAFNEAYNYVRNPNVKNSSGDTILTYAILMRKYPIIASIIAKGADLDLPNALGYTPLQIAIELNDFKAVEFLVNNKADLSYIDSSGKNYLMYAARVGNLSSVDLLIKKGVNIDVLDNEGATALAIANRSGQNIVAQFLLKNGANPNAARIYEVKQNSIINELENRWK
jgi:ankyrin repeat protein